jgi:lysine biosynthesis protein LysW
MTPTSNRVLPRVLCPNCGEDIVLGSPIVRGATVTCAGCGASLTVIDLDPPALRAVYFNVKSEGEQRTWAAPSRWFG